MVGLGAAVTASVGASVEADDTAGAGGVITVRAPHGKVTLFPDTTLFRSTGGGTGAAGGQVSLWTGTAGNTIGQGTSTIVADGSNGTDGKAKVLGNGEVTLDQANNVGTLAASVSDAAAQFTYNDTSALTLD